MVIAHVLSSFGMGGQERVALDLARGQLASGKRVLAVSLAGDHDGAHARSFRSAGAEVYALSKRAGLDWQLMRELRALFRAQRVSVVHTHNPHALIYGAPAGKLAGAVVVHSKHGANPDTARRYWLRRIASEFVDAYVAVSPTTAEVARRARDCAPGKLHMIENGIDLSEFGRDADARIAVRRELGISENARVIGSVGRLAPEKNQKLMIDALAPELSETLVLVIVGSGPEAQSLRERAAALPTGQHVILPGVRTDVARVLSAFDVFVLSSVTEGLPLVIPEAMASGLPVVSTAVGGIPDVIDEGKTGFLVPSGDADALRAKLMQLVAAPELCRQMGERARSVALERYGADRMLRDYMALYAPRGQRGSGTAFRGAEAHS